MSMLLASGIPDKSFQVILEDRAQQEEGTTTSAMIMRHVNDYNASTLVVGQFGRKGPSAWSSGTNADGTLQLAHLMEAVTVVTAKPNSRDNDRPRTFVVGMDGSSRSRAALKYAMERARRGDEISIVHVRNEVNESLGFNPLEEIELRAKEDCKNFIETKSLIVEMKYLGRNLLMRLSDQVLQFAKEKEATYVVIGRDGDAAVERARRMKTGTVAGKIVHQSRMTSIVVG